MPRPCTWSACRRVASLAVLFVAAWVLVACGKRSERSPWLSDDVAVLRCAVAGRAHTAPSAWHELPVPLPPTQLYVRAMDPAALEDLGFTRDAPVCAALIAPGSGQLAEADTGLARLAERVSEADLALRSAGGCACPDARALGLAHLFPTCRRPRRQAASCDDDPTRRAQVASLAAPVRAAIEEAAGLRRHWRLFGAADRPGRFVARFSEIVGKYGGGSELFVPGMKVAGGRSDALVNALLEQPHVLAVVRQDAGQGVLVVRSRRGELVLDHFEHPPLDEAYARMRGELDDAAIPYYLAALAPGDGGMRLHFDPRRGALMMIDRGALDRVDEGTVVSSRLGSPRLDRGPAFEGPPALVERLEFFVPAAHEGARIEGWVQLGDEGLAAVEAVPATELAVTFDELPFDPEPPPASPWPAGTFVGRGAPATVALLDGIHGLFAVLHAVERAQPGSLRGNLDAFTVDLPSGPLPGALSTRAGLEGLRGRLSKRAQRLEVRRDGAVYSFTLAPRY